MKDVIVGALLLITMLNGPVLAEEPTVLARVGDRTITMADLNKFISYHEPSQQKLIKQNPQYKVALLKRLVQATVIADIAREKGLDKEKDIQERIEVLTNEFLATEYVKRDILPGVTVTEDDLTVYYKTHQDEFKTPETVRARHILIKANKSASEEEKKQAREKAEGILKRAKTGEDFATLASEFSDDPGSKTKGGDLGYFQRGRMVKPFEEAAFSLAPGSISDIVETQFGYHIIKVEDKKEASAEPFDKVKEKVREKVTADLRKAKVEEFVEKAMKEAGVELDLEPLAPKK